MVLEVIQWAVMLVMAVLLLGVIRQLPVIQPMALRAIQATGLPVGERIPKAALKAIEAAIPAGVLPESLVVGFVSENCVACQHLLGNVTRIGSEALGEVVLVTRSENPEFVAALRGTGAAVVDDVGGRMWSACGVTATPLLIRIDSQAKIVSKEVTSNVGTLLAGSVG